MEVTRQQRPGLNLLYNSNKQQLLCLRLLLHRVLLPKVRPFHSSTPSCIAAR
jgi:hypothetical protein